MEQGLRDCCRSIRIGKILIQSDEETQRAKVYYAKFPPDIYRRKVLLMYPILSEWLERRQKTVSKCVFCQLDLKLPWALHWRFLLCNNRVYISQTVSAKAPLSENEHIEAKYLRR